MKNGRVWETNELPDDWKEGYLIKLPKKGDLKNCKNWRGIMLLSTAGKVLKRIILAWLFQPTLPPRPDLARSKLVLLLKSKALCCLEPVRSDTRDCSARILASNFEIISKTTFPITYNTIVSELFYSQTPSSGSLWNHLKFVLESAPFRGEIYLIALKSSCRPYWLS